MLGAYLYKLRKQLFRRKGNLLLGLFMLTVVVLILFFVYKETGKNTETISGEALGLFGILTFATMSLNLISIFQKNVYGYELADIVFQFVTPFSQRLNRIISLKYLLKSAFFYVYFVVFLSGAIVDSFKINSMDFTVLLVVIFLVVFSGMVFVNNIVPYFCYNDKARKVFNFAYIFTLLVTLGEVFYRLYQVAGSIENIRNLNYMRVFEAINSSYIIRYFPLTGSIFNIYEGIVYSNVVLIIVGITITSLTLFLMMYISSKCNTEYYELAIETANNMAEKIAAKKAGVNHSTKVAYANKEVLDKGYGAKALFYSMRLQMRRYSKLYYIDSHLIYFRFITIFVWRNQSFEMEHFLSSCMFGSILFYGAGQFIMNCRKIYFQLIPESNLSKIFYSIIADFETVVLDVVICLLSAVYILKIDGTTFEFFCFAVAFLTSAYLIKILSITIYLLLGDGRSVGTQRIVNCLVIMFSIILIGILSKLLGNVLINSFIARSVICVLCSFGLIALSSKLYERG